MENEINEYGLPEILRDGLEETEYNHRIKYRNLYLRLIESGKNMTPEELSGYNEKHHILPKCLGGKDDESNLVLLPCRYHVLAHLILLEIYPDHQGIAYAAHCLMVWDKTGKRIESIQKHFSSRIISQAKEKAYKSLVGRKLSSETKMKMSLSRSGEKHHAYGKIFSEEYRRKLSEAQSGSKNHNYGKKFSDEHRKKLSESLSGNKNYNYGRKYSEERKKRISDATSGEKNPFYGKTHSKDSKRKMSESQRKRARKVKGPDGVIYNGITDAFEKTGIPKTTLLSRLSGKLKSNKGWSYCDDLVNSNDENYMWTRWKKV